MEHRGFSRLIDVVNIILERSRSRGDQASSDHAIISEDDCSVIADLLKALFNLSCGYEERNDLDEEEVSLLCKMAELLQILILIDSGNHVNKELVVGNCVNVLTSFKGEWMSALIGSIPKDFTPSDYKEIEYDGNNMNACQTLLHYLDYALEKVI